MTTTQANNSDVLESALQILGLGYFRFHTDATCFKFTNRSRTLQKFGLTPESKFGALIGNIVVNDDAQFGNHMSVNLRGLLAIAAALSETQISETPIRTIESTIRGTGLYGSIEEDNLRLMTRAYVPWTKMPERTSLEEAAARLYQRRIRRGESTQSAYKDLITNIIRNAYSHTEEGYMYRPAREDMREAKQLMSGR